MRVDAAAAGIGPDQFWTLTPFEIILTIRGYSRRMRQFWRMTATLGAWTLNAWGAETKPSKLIPGIDEDE